jgi:hypothetical protein
LNLLQAIITTTHDDLLGHGVVSGRGIPRKWRGRSYKRRVMIERVIQRKVANSFVASNDFDDWVTLLNEWTGAIKTRQELEDAIRERCQECK